MGNKEIGGNGEEIAARHLESNGFEVVTRNYHKPWGEIDIVAKKDDTLRFVEVKTLSVPARLWGSGFRPEEKVDMGKIRRIYRAAETYLADHDIDLEWQIDVVAVLLDPETGERRVEVIEHAFFD